MDSTQFLEQFPEIAEGVEKWPTKVKAFKVGYEAAILMILSHEAATGHEWVQAAGFSTGRCDDCIEGE